MRIGQAFPHILSASYRIGIDEGEFGSETSKDITPLRYSARQCDRSLGAVLLGLRGLRFEVTGDVLDEHDRVPDLVGIEDVRRQRVAAPVAFTAIRVHTDTGHLATGKVNGSDSTDRSAAVKVSSVPGLIS
jgi:hypothetical protein